MKWRSVEGNLLIGNRIKCTWESQNENGLGIDVCMHTHSANRRESNSQIITKMVKIPGTWQENVPKEIQIFKDIDGWITIKTTRTHFASRGNVERTFYQAICPEHVPAYEAEQSLINAQAVNQAERAAQERAEQQAERDRVAARQAELNRERAEATARREQAQREAQERERINNEKFNIWVHHEKNEIL